MKSDFTFRTITPGLLALGLTFALSAQAQQDTAALAKAAQNPIASMISLPLQNNFNFNVGPNNGTQYILNIQPVYPVGLSEDWNLINRLILPLIDQPSPIAGQGSKFGLGDIQYQAFFSPKKPARGWTWGAGPVLSLPTATDPILGTEKVSAGPGFVALRSDGPWLYGALVNNLWSFAGNGNRSSVNQMLIQWFVNYNLNDGWYLTTSPIITANWNSRSSDRWTVPLGGGIGKIHRFGQQPVNIQLQAFSYVEKPTGGPDWGLRFQVQLLFPK